MAFKISEVRINDGKEYILAERLSSEFIKQVKQFESGNRTLKKPNKAGKGWGKSTTYFFGFPNVKRKGIHGFIKSAALRTGVLLLDLSKEKKKPIYKFSEKRKAHYRDILPDGCSEVLLISNFPHAMEKIAEILTKDTPIRIINTEKKPNFNFIETPEEQERHAKRSERLSRPEQAGFRKMLLKEYKSTCAITECTVESVLEAAHIIPVAKKSNYKLGNGLLLRSDLHLLFDANLMSIDPATDKVHFKETGEHYNKYDQKIVDISKASRINLTAHWQKYNR